MDELTVIRMGHPVLRAEAEILSAELLKEEETQLFIDALIKTMHLHEGVGIAAPQVAVLKRIFIMEAQENSRYPNRNGFELRVAVNPVLEFLTDEMVDSWEGCLSIPNLRGQLKRHKRVKLSALDRNGEAYSVDLDGFEAIVAQHEFDHLNGVLLVDRMDSMETLTFDEEYEQFWI